MLDWISGLGNRALKCLKHFSDSAAHTVGLESSRSLEFGRELGFMKKLMKDARVDVEVLHIM